MRKSGNVLRKRIALLFKSGVNLPFDRPPIKKIVDIVGDLTLYEVKELVDVAIDDHEAEFIGQLREEREESDLSQFSLLAKRLEDQTEFSAKKEFVESAPNQASDQLAVDCHQLLPFDPNDRSGIVELPSNHPSHVRTLVLSVLLDKKWHTEGELIGEVYIRCSPHLPVRHSRATRNRPLSDLDSEHLDGARKLVKLVIKNLLKKKVIEKKLGNHQTEYRQIRDVDTEEAEVVDQYLREMASYKSRSPQEKAKS